MICQPNPPRIYTEPYWTWLGHTLWLFIYTGCVRRTVPSVKFPFHSPSFIPSRICSWMIVFSHIFSISVTSVLIWIYDQSVAFSFAFTDDKLQIHIGILHSLIYINRWCHKMEYNWLLTIYPHIIWCYSEINKIVTKIFCFICRFQPVINIFTFSIIWSFKRAHSFIQGSLWSVCGHAFSITETIMIENKRH